MRIAVSLLAFRPGRIGGAETYLRNLLDQLPRVARGEALVAVMDRDVAASLETPGFERVVVDRSARSVVAGRILEAFTPWRERALERLFAGLGADVAFFPQQSLFPRDVPTPAVLTAVDVQHLVFPEYFPLFDRLYRPRIYPPSMARARKVISISEFTRSELVARCGVPPEKVVAIPLGVTRTDVSGIAPYPGLGAYLYYPAASFPHKSHLTLLETYAALRRAGRMPYRLVLSGVRTNAWRPVQRRVASLGLGEAVTDLGYVPFADVRRLYAGAEAVLFPTRYEGFGLPVTEAVEHEKKVIVSDIPVFRELGVPARWRIDFANPDQLAAALAQPGPTRLEVEPITWAECARRTLEVLRAAAGASSP